MIRFVTCIYIIGWRYDKHYRFWLCWVQGNHFLYQFIWHHLGLLPSITSTWLHDYSFTGVLCDIHFTPVLRLVCWITRWWSYSFLLLLYIHIQTWFFLFLSVWSLSLLLDSLSVPLLLTVSTFVLRKSIWKNIKLKPCYIKVIDNFLNVKSFVLFFYVCIYEVLGHSSNVKCYVKV